jgi:ketosteroid isomerase-like protein
LHTNDEACLPVAVTLYVEHLGRRSTRFSPGALGVGECATILDGMAAKDAAFARGEDSIERVGRVFDAFARRDIRGALEFMHPQVRLWVVTAAVVRGGRPYVGHKGIREYFRDVDRIWERLELKPVEFDKVGEAVVVVGEVHARGPAGELRQPTVWTWKFTSGLVIDCRVDSDVGAARQALGESQNVEDLLRSYIAAYNDRNVDALIALADPRIAARPAGMSRRRYVGHRGLRNWMRDVLAGDYGQTVVVWEVRKLERDRWALLGSIVVDGAQVSPFAALMSVADGLITDAREYLSDESLLRELDHLP